MKYRIDSLELTDVRLDAASGFMRGKAYATKPGVVSYRRPDGSTRRELRPPAEVLKPESMATLRSVPIVNGHPKEKLLTPETVKVLTVGWTGSDVSADPQTGIVTVDAVIADAAAIRDAQAGKLGLSCGYQMDLDPTPGEFNGERYDAIQTNIRYNHVAMTGAPRLGSDMRFVRLDSNDDLIVQDETDTDKRRPAMAKIRIDDVEFEVADNALASAVAAGLGKRDERIKALSTEATTATARADSADSELKTLKASTLSADQINAGVKARLSTLGKAAKVIKDQSVLDSLPEKNERDIMTAAIQARQSDVKLDGKSDEYVQARFDAVMESVAAGNAGAVNTAAAGARGDGENQLDKSYGRFLTRLYGQPAKAKE